MNNNILSEGRLSTLYLRFVIPSVIAMVISGIQGMIDGIFLGNFVDANAMASVNIANPYMQVIVGATMIVCTGTLSYLGRTLGENNREKAKDIFKSSVIALLVLSIIILLLGVLFHKGIAVLLGANDVLLTSASQYIAIIAFFTPVISFMIFFGFTDRLMGKPNLYPIATVFCLITNIVMDFIAVKILELGVIGAAIATGVSYLVGLMIVIKPVLSRKGIVNIFEGKFCWKIFSHSAFNGSSEGATYVSAALTMLLFNRAFMSFAGEKGVAAFTVINYLGTFVTLIMFGVSDGISSIVSYNYGAGKLERVRKTFFSSVVINFLWGVLLILVLKLYAEELIKIFLKNEPEILQTAIKGAKIYALSFFFSGFNIVQSGYHTSVGNALASFCIAASRGIVFVSIGITVLPYFFGMNGVWATLPFAEIMTLFLCVGLMRVYRDLYFKPKEV